MEKSESTKTNDKVKGAEGFPTIVIGKMPPPPTEGKYKSVKTKKSRRKNDSPGPVEMGPNMRRHL